MNNRPKTPHGFTRLIIGDGSAVSEQKNIIWNMIGSFLYAFASMVLSIAVVQLAGEDAGGVFTFAFTTFGQHMFMAAYFGIRPFQITDTGEKYTFGDYLGLRLITCGLAILVGFGYVLVSGYTFEKAAVVFLMVVYKVIDALADTYEAEFQRGGRLYLTGKSNAFRTILSVTCFLGSLAVTGTPECDMEVGARKEIPALPGQCSVIFLGGSGLLYLFCIKIRHRGPYGRP